MRNKLRSKKFWFSLAGAGILLLNLLGFRVDAPYVNEVLNAICGVLIVVGLMDELQSEDIKIDTLLFDKISLDVLARKIEEKYVKICRFCL